MATNKYFTGVEAHEINIISDICADIEAGRITVFSTDRRFKIMSPGANGYMYDWTYNFCRWGFAKCARNTQFHAAQHAYCPIQHISAILANFINTAVEMGYYTRTTSRRFDGGQNVQIVWL